jgi:DNA-binding transcriptional regulator WhiA
VCNRRSSGGCSEPPKAGLLSKQGQKKKGKRREMEKVSEFLKGIQTLEFRFKFEFEQKKEQCT